MQITTKADSDTKTVDIIFTNDGLNTNEFIDMVIDGEEYTISIDDLYHISNLFMKIKDNKNE